MGVTYDAGALVAAERGERRMWARHRALLMMREIPVVPAPVVAQAWRGGARQAPLARFLIGSKIEAMTDNQARAVGVFAGRAGIADIVDVCVVEGALRRRDMVITADAKDLTAIASAVGRHLEVERP